jgi:hypothetical protein
MIVIPPMIAFQARAEARAILFRAGALSLHDAVDKLQADAEASGLTAEIGPDRVQQILSRAFETRVAS